MNEIIYVIVKLEIKEEQIKKNDREIALSEIVGDANKSLKMKWSLKHKDIINAEIVRWSDEPKYNR